MSFTVTGTLRSVNRDPSSGVTTLLIDGNTIVCHMHLESYEAWRLLIGTSVQIDVTSQA